MALVMAGGAVLLKAPQATSSRQVSFVSWRQVPFGIQSESLDAADFNHDGYDDLVVMDGALVVLLLSDERAHFSPPLLQRRAGAGAQQVIARDFSGDGNADVAVAYGDGDLWVFLGDGRGSLSNGERFPTGGAPTALAATDFNGDGTLDVVVADAGGSVTGRVRFMRNDGAGNFAPVDSAPPAGRAPARIASGDFDHDGRADVAVTNKYDRAVTVLFGDGTGGVSDHLTLATTSSADPVLSYALAAGDVNGDGADDLVVGNRMFAPSGISSGSNGALLLSTGGRGFEPPVPLPVDNGVLDLRLLDINGDGRLDIAASGDRGFLTLVRTADSGFRRQLRVSVQDIALTSGDFNGDNLVDFAVVGLFPRVDLFLGLPGGRLPPDPVFIRTQRDPELGAQVFQPSQVVAADLNNDGILDLVTTTGQARTIVAFLGMGDGVFDRPLASIVGRPSGLFAAADFNADGSIDLAVAVEREQLRGVELFAGNGRGQFTRAGTVAAGGDYEPVVAADFDRNGTPDLAAVFRRYDPPAAGVDVFLNDGGKEFRRVAVLSPHEPPVNVLTADLNRDDLVDLVLQNGTDLTVFLGHGDGTFSDELRVPAAITGGIVGIALADFDEDGFPDLAISQGAARDSDAFATFSLRGDGRGAFSNPVHLTPEHVGLHTQGSFVGRVTADDFNGDGHADIAAASSGGVTVFQGDGRGNFAPASSYFGVWTGCETSCALTALDLNGDGLTDLTTPYGSIDEGGLNVTLTLLFNNTPPSRLVAGDANCDEQVGPEDLAALTRRLFSEFYRPACVGADANGDGVETAADFAAILTRGGA